VVPARLHWSGQGDKSQGVPEVLRVFCYVPVIKTDCGGGVFFWGRGVLGLGGLAKPSFQMELEKLYVQERKVDSKGHLGNVSHCRPNILHL
jgi:hypothetical protein